MDSDGRSGADIRPWPVHPQPVVGSYGTPHGVDVSQILLDLFYPRLNVHAYRLRLTTHSRLASPRHPIPFVMGSSQDYGFTLLTKRRNLSRSPLPSAGRGNPTSYQDRFVIQYDYSDYRLLVASGLRLGPLWQETGKIPRWILIPPYS